jgi:AcrR family transcriptional regulator
MSAAPPPRVPRRPGRPPQSSSEETRTRILDAALTSVARHGFDGARLKEIADVAGVHTALVHHYFGDKGRLYNSVLQRALSPLNEKGTLLLTPDMDMALVVEGFVSLIMFFFVEKRDVILLMTREALNGADSLTATIKETIKPLFDEAVGFFAEARRRGDVPDLDPAQMVFTVVGAVGLYFTHHAMVAQVLGTDPLAPEQIEHRRQELVRMLLALMRRPAPNP